MKHQPSLSIAIKFWNNPNTITYRLAKNFLFISKSFRREKCKSILTSYKI